VSAVTLSISTWLEVRAGRRLSTNSVLVERFLDGRDEVAEEHLRRRGLDAVWALVRVLERRREKLMLSGLDERVRIGVLPVSRIIRAAATSIPHDRTARHPDVRGGST
jgi:hypothetical protein